MTPDPDFAAQVERVRHFNRFYTRQIGVLQGKWLESRFSLTEARVLYELSRRERATASDIVEELGIDRGYLSRIVAKFAEDGLISRRRGAKDGRQVQLALTPKGRRDFAPLDRRSNDQVGGMLKKLTPAGRARVGEAMATIESIVAGNRPAVRQPVLRPHRPGDMGWVVARHGEIYAREYGWDSRIEALTADIVSAFLKNFDPARERCWIAELGGEPVGSVFLVRDSQDVARLRLLIVDPVARGHGIGRSLVDECIAFARQAGYRKITLWTHAVLTAARAIYKQTGFTLVEEWVHDEFGKPEASETWELEL